MRRALKPAAFVACLLPLAWLVVRLVTDRLGPDPAARVLDVTGWWALTLLMITLAATPVQKLLRWSALLRLRRLLGVFAFFYGTLHLAAYVAFEHAFDFAGIWEDVLKRGFMTAGAVAWLSMMPLAITSTQGWIRRLGFKRWKALHRLAYVAAIAAVIHFWWKVKIVGPEQWLFAGLLAASLGVRLFVRQRTREPEGAVLKDSR